MVVGWCCFFGVTVVLVFAVVVANFVPVLVCIISLLSLYVVGLFVFVAPFLDGKTIYIVRNGIVFLTHCQCRYS